MWREAALSMGRVTRYLRVSLSSLPTPARTRVLVLEDMWVSAGIGVGKKRSG